MRTFRLMAALVLGLVCVQTAAAQNSGSSYLKQVDNWTIATRKDGKCLAYNRPGEEFNVAPFNALWIIRGPRESDYGIEVFFWPNAFTAGEKVILEISNDMDLTIKYDAVAGQSYAIRTDEPVRYFDIRRMADAPLMHVRTPNIRQELMFDISDLRSVLEHLNACYAGARN